MTVVNDDHDRAVLQDIAKRAMLERGLFPYFSAESLIELNNIQAPASIGSDKALDLRDLLWSSIDNDDSRDLDQLTVAEVMPDGRLKIRVAVADVDSLVKKGSALDKQACRNTTSVYTPGQIFPMLPEKLSYDLTSLNLNQDRPTIVIEMVVGADGSIQDSGVYRAVVRNHAKLAYNRVAAWLEGSTDIPPEIMAVKGLTENLRLQDRAAQSMKNLRHIKGALCLETIEAKPVFEDNCLIDLQVEEKNRAKDIIENFMIAANVAIIRYLASKNLPSIRRVVRTPKRWDRIVEIAARRGFKLPKNPDSRALELFLTMEKKADPLRFPDLSLAIIKLLGSGEYVAELPGKDATGHFGLAVRDYTHSTAPNRRYPDLITQRLLKAAIDAKPMPYSKGELDDLAAHCTHQEDAAAKVERQVGKSAAGLLIKSRIGEQFDAMVTGAAPKGTWVRLLDMPIEGMLKLGCQGVDVGDRIRVKLISVDVEQGFIDFERVGRPQH
ncbi:MAG: RNB domain-containing ribonuclease [Methanotrichaceae archaeon]